MLDRCGISDVGVWIEWASERASLLMRLHPVQDFIHRLLEVRPAIRMSAEGCLEHPWLLGAGDDLAAVREGRVPYPEPLPLVPHGAMSQDSIDVSMSILLQHGGNEVVADMSLDDRRGAVGDVQQQQGAFSQITNPSQNPTYHMPGAFHHPSTRHGLQRRSKVIADAESSGKKLPEIPEEMIAKANAENEAGLSTANRDYHDVSMDNEGASNLAAVPEESELPEQEEPKFGSQPREPEHGVRRSKRTPRTAEPESATVRGHGKHGASGAGTRTKRGASRRIADVQEEDEMMRETASPKKSRR